MIKTYFKTAWRNLKRNRVYSFINIAGLATGMAVALLIGLWIWDEASFNSYFSHHSRLAQVMINQTENGEIYTGGTIAMPSGDALRTRHKEEFKKVSLASWNDGHVLTSGDKMLTGTGMWVQQDFPGMFTLNMVYGNREALKDPSSLLLSRSLAEALFGKTDPVNKTVRLDNKQEMKVGGVYENLPHNTTFYGTNLLLPWENNENWMWTTARNDWNNHCGQLFVELNDGVSFSQATERIKNIPSPHIKKWKEEFLLHPLDKLHLYSEFENGKIAGGRIEMVRLIGIIGVFVLLLACINFMNLSTARSEKRAKEVGIRKTVGSLRKQLIVQFIAESVMVAFLSFVLSLVLLQLSLPFFNNLADKQMSIGWTNPWFWFLSLSFTLFTGIIAGSYPAFYLSSFRPIKVLKGVFRAGRLASLPRKVLVVVQFTVSIALIIGTVVVFRQVQYTKNRPAGYSREGLVAVPITPAMYGRHDLVRNELLQSGVVKNVAVSSYSTSHFASNNSIEWRGMDPQLTVFFRNVDVSHEFGKTVGWTIKEGRDFSREFATDSSAAIVNETAVKVMGLQHPVGEEIKYGNETYTIIGVVKDMLTQSPYEPMQPSVFFTKGWMRVFVIKVNPAVSVSESLAKIGSIFRKYDSQVPFSYRFVDDEYARKYANEERLARLAGFFAVLAIFISCLGLFGLSSFVAEQRRKEIGVRKILGASVFRITALLSRDFLRLVLVSFVIASPLAWWVMSGWLSDYAYRVTISGWVFLVTGLFSVLIAILTVSFQSIKAAIVNPVKSLRTE